MKKRLLTLLAMLPLLGFGQMTENFEGTWTVPTGALGSGGPAGWAIADVGGPIQKWEQGTGGSYSGSHHATIAPENVVDGTEAEDWLITNSFTVPADGVLNFYSKMGQVGDQGGAYKVMIKTGVNGLADQTNLSNYVPLTQWTELEINPVQTQWTQKTVSLANYVGQVVYLAFIAKGDEADTWMIDNVSVNQNCPQPTNIIVTNISMTAATIGWVSPPGVTAWEIEVVPANMPFSGMGVATTSNPFTMASLMPGQDYHICVRSVCGPGVYSNCTSGSFTTPLCMAELQCIYTFNLTDTGGNGWNGNTMSVVQNGITVSTLALASGASQSVDVPLCSEIPFQLYWNAGGQNAEEVGIQVVNGYEQTIYTKTPGNGAQNTLLYQGFTFCYADGCPEPYFVTATTAGTSATVSWSDLSNGLWQYYVAEAGAPVPDSNTVPTGSANTNPFTIQNLETETDYVVYVRTVCADAGGPFNTSWSQPAYFSIGTGNFITGMVGVDANGDGICNQNDFGIQGVEVIGTIGTGAPVSVYADAQGNYIIDDIPAGTDVPVAIQVVAPQGFEAQLPVNLELDFPLSTPQQFNFCLPVPEGAESDIAVILAPLNNPQAGFQAHYAVIVQNNSPIPATGVTVTITYQSANVSVVSSTGGYTVAGPNAITLQPGNIAPFGTTTVGVVFSVLPPPVNSGGEVLEFTAVADMAVTDSNEDDNISMLTQTVVNSFDPNDITVHEGNWVPMDQAGEYLHYTIRFQNTGTAPAVNIRVENELDAHLDWDTFDPIAASHDFTATRRNGNELEFKFTNILLADSNSNEPASHGFVTYRIKPKADIALNDVVHSTAGIFFDFNDPVITNTATTTFGVLGLSDAQAEQIVLYPNPVKDELHINVLQSGLKNVSVYDLNGRLCLTSGNQSIISMQPLTPGLYMVKVETDKGLSSFKLIKQ